MADGKWIAGLTPDMPVADAARVVFAARFEVVRRYLPLAAEKPYEDSEYVHQLRVGTRRAGAALKVFGDWLPRKHLKRAKRSLRTLRQAAGGARDWDVFIQGLPEAKPLTAPSGKPALDFLLGYALGERAAAQVRLVEAAAADGPTFVAESTTLPDHVREPDGDAVPESLATLAIAHLGGLIDDFTAAIRAEPTAPADLHQLRIRGKRLRYAIELFADCFAAALREDLYPAIEDVQELLGGSQDAAVGVERLEGLRGRVDLLLPAEGPRLRPGISGLLRGARSKIAAVRKKFAAWRNRWETIATEHPLASLRLAGAPATH